MQPTCILIITLAGIIKTCPVDNNNSFGSFILPSPLIIIIIEATSLFSNS